MIADIEVYLPNRLDEALAWLADHGTRGKVLAGGTDLMVYLNARSFIAPAYLNIWGLPELRGIRDEGDSIWLGALTTYTEIINSPLVRRHAPALVDAARTVGAAQIQNRGTIGGNIVNASPAGDTLPVLAVLAAELEAGSLRGTRRVPFNDFYPSYRQTVLAPDELLLGVHLAKSNLGHPQAFHKVGTRRAQAISKVVVAINARVEGGRVAAAQIAVGSVAPTVIRARRTEDYLMGRELGAETIGAAMELIKGEISPIDDIRSTAHYRRTVTANVLRRLLRLIGRGTNGAGG